MDKMLLAAAGSLAAIAAPVQAQDWGQGGSGTQFAAGRSADSGHWNGQGRHHDRRRHGGGDFAGPWGWYGGDWAYYNNRSFEPDSYNDWWHDRPDRAFPRWMQNNQNCARLWWSGGGWRC